MGERSTTHDDERIARLVADADVLAADLLVGGPAREALDIVRAHDWVTLVATAELLDDAEAVVQKLADADLAADWRTLVEERVTLVAQPPGDHPGLAAAYAGDAAHLLSYDERLLSAKAGARLQGRVAVSVRPPEAFVRLFDPESVHEAAFGEPEDPDERSST